MYFKIVGIIGDVNIGIRNERSRVQCQCSIFDRPVGNT